MAKTAKTAGTGLDLFGKAKSKPASKAKSEKEIISVTDPVVAQAIIDYEKAKNAENEAKRVKAAAESVIKQYAKETYIQMYEKTGKRPDSFIIAGKTKDETDQVMHIVMDSYKKIDEDQYEYLKDTYGEDVVEDSSEFIFNKEMIQTYGKEISEAIAKHKGIPAEAKTEIIFKQESYNITKGTIERLPEIAKAAKTTIAVLFEEFGPTQQLKSNGQK